MKNRGFPVDKNDLSQEGWTLNSSCCVLVVRAWDPRDWFLKSVDSVVESFLIRVFDFFHEIKGNKKAPYRTGRETAFVRKPYCSLWLRLRLRLPSKRDRRCHLRAEASSTDHCRRVTCNLVSGSCGAGTSGTSTPASPHPRCESPLLCACT